VWTACTSRYNIKIHVHYSTQSNTSIHTVRSVRVPNPHNHSQHIQANATRGFVQSVLLTIGIMMPETR